LPGVRDAAVIAREVPGARAQEILLAVAGEGWDPTRMRNTLREHVAPIALPRRYRFVAELPREATGKLRRESLLALFAAQDSEEAVTQMERGASTRERDEKGEHVRVALRVPEALMYFEGHFEGWPVLPGVVQLGLIAVGEALVAWPELGGLRRVRRLKLKRPIAPGAALALELTRSAVDKDPEHVRVDFVLTLVEGNELCSSGSLAFGKQRGAAS
jgi:3-hydroxymyristoyl/3-hydroxydecanoyl-(acyl carrier protein) dehydratase